MNIKQEIKEVIVFFILALLFWLWIFKDDLIRYYQLY
jgi:hypothetical protein